MFKFKIYKPLVYAKLFCLSTKLPAFMSAAFILTTVLNQRLLEFWNSCSLEIKSNAEMLVRKWFKKSDKSFQQLKKPKTFSNQIRCQPPPIILENLRAIILQTYPENMSWALGPTSNLLGFFWSAGVGPPLDVFPLLMAQDFKSVKSWPTIPPSSPPSLKDLIKFVRLTLGRSE